jgi:hypothetical protein
VVNTFFADDEYFEQHLGHVSRLTQDMDHGGLVLDPQEAFISSPFVQLVKRFALIEFDEEVQISK